MKKRFLVWLEGIACRFLRSRGYGMRLPMLEKHPDIPVICGRQDYELVEMISEIDLFDRLPPLLAHIYAVEGLLPQLRNIVQSETYRSNRRACDVYKVSIMIGKKI